MERQKNEALSQGKKIESQKEGKIFVGNCIHESCGQDTITEKYI